MMRSLLAAALAVLLIPCAARADFRAGVAVRVVTPNPLLPVSGGVGPSNPVREKRGDLTVRALVFQQNTTRVAIVSADFLGFPRTLGDRVRAAVQGIPAENILIGVTHTHSAPDCYGFPDESGQSTANGPYLQSVCERMVEAVQEALAQLQPAHLRIATDDAKGKIAYNYYAPDLYDPRCHVIQVVKPSGGNLATLINYAIHPEVLGSERGILSPDLLGPLYERIAHQGGGVALFMNSAQGGMVTADVRRPDGGENNTWEECQRIGNLLADEALRIVSHAPIQPDPALACFSREIRIPVESDLMRKLLDAMPAGSIPQSDHAILTRLNVVHLGNAQILTIPGEALPNIGYYLKRKMRGKHNLLFGLTNDAYGYLLTRVDFNSFKRYNYISRTSLGENAGETFITEALQFVHSLPPPEEGR